MNKLRPSGTYYLLSVVFVLLINSYTTFCVSKGMSLWLTNNLYGQISLDFLVHNTMYEEFKILLLILHSETAMRNSGVTSNT